MAMWVPPCIAISYGAAHWLAGRHTPVPLANHVFSIISVSDHQDAGSMLWPLFVTLIGTDMTYHFSVDVPLRI